MNTREKQTKEIIENFCNAFFFERNAEKALSYLSEDLIWTGLNKKSGTTDYITLKTLLLIDISLIKSSFEITPLSENILKITKDVYNINYSFKLYNKKINIELDISLLATILFSKNETKVLTLNFDYINKPQIESNYSIHHNHGGLIIIDYKSEDFLSIELINEKFINIFNLNKEKADSLLNTNIYDYIYEEDIIPLKDIISTNLENNNDDSFSCSFRINIDNKIIWAFAIAIRKKENNSDKFFIIIRPIEQFEIKKSLEIEDLDLENNTYKIQITGTHRNILDDKLTIEDISPDLCKFLSYSEQEIIKNTNRNYYNLIDKNDIKYVQSTYNKLKTNRPKKYLVYRLINKKGQSIWIKESLSISKVEKNKIHTYSIVEELKYLNSDATIYETPSFMPKSIESIFFVIDLVNMKFNTEAFKNSQIKFINKYVQDLPNSLIELELIYNEDIISFLQFFKNIQVKQKNNWIGRVKLKNNKIGWFQIISYTLFNNNMPIKSLCTIINIDNKKNIDNILSKRQEFMDIIINEYDFLAEYDLLENKAIFLYSPKAPKDFYENMKINNFDYFLNNVIHPDFTHQLIKIQNNYINCTLNGITPKDHSYEFKYRSVTKRFEGYQWGKMNYIYKFDKHTKHLHLIILLRNIDEIKKNELALLENVSKNN